MEVSLASQAHHVPHVGLPHILPVISAKKVNIAPIGASDLPAKLSKGFLSINQNTDDNAINV